MTTRSLESLQKEPPESGIDERRFRPTIVIDADFSDDKLLGCHITINNLILVVTHSTKRCRMLTIKQSDLNSLPKIFKKIAKTYQLNIGVYASVIQSGSISIKDKVSIVTVNS